MAHGALSHPLATEQAPLCAGPRPEMRAPAWPVPFGACCCHAHVIGDGEEHPFVATRGYTPPAASEAQYLRMLDGLGLTHGVLVQISVHGTDNSLMVECATTQTVARRRGVRARRAGRQLQMLDGRAAGLQRRPAAASAEALEVLAAHRAHGLAYPAAGHARTAGQWPRLPALPVDVVIDHMAYIKPPDGVANPAYQVMLDLLKTGRTWVKISGAYRNSLQDHEWSDTDDVAMGLIAARADRLVWGTDWPHTHRAKVMFHTGETLETLGRWMPDAALRKRVLVDNPAKLYGF